MKKIARLICGVLTMVLLSSCTTPVQTSSMPPPISPIPVPSSAPVEELPPVTSTLSFSAVGDNLIHSSLYNQAAARATNGGYDFAYAYDNVRYFFENKDINLINQETLISDELTPSDYPQFCSPGQVAHEAYRTGWNVFVLSNNHTYDRGAKGLDSTLRFWEAMPEDVVNTGLFENTENDSGIALQERNGITFAYLAFAENTNGIPVPTSHPARVVLTKELDLMEHLIRRANDLADVVVVNLHWGVEYRFDITNAQRELAQKVVDWGADLIVGGHPHVIQPVEWVTSNETGKPVLVAYSMGNFISAQAHRQNMVGLVLSMDFSQTTYPDGAKSEVEINNIKIHPTVTHYDSGYKNIRVYLYRDYSDALASQHGCQKRDGTGSFSMAYISQLAEIYISPEFLDLS